MDARVTTLWYLLQRIIEICCIQIKNARALEYLTGMRGQYRDLWARYEFTHGMNERAESYVNCISPGGPAKAGPNAKTALHTQTHAATQKKD